MPDHPPGRARSGSRDRGQFVLTVALIALLTLSGCALIRLLPERSGSSGTALSESPPVASNTSADAHLEPVRRIMAAFGDLRQTRAPGTGAVVLAHPGHEELADRLTAELPAALTAVAGFWGDTEWTHTAVLTVATDRTEFAALLRATEPPSTAIAAAAIADPFVFGTPPTGQRVVFAPDAGRLPPEQLRTLLRHELTHLATRAHTAEDAPEWMVEGFADYVAHRGLGHTFAEIAPALRAAARSGELPTVLPADAAFTGPDAATTYERAWSLCAYIADRHDEPQLIRLYRVLASPGRPDQDRTLREVLGDDRAVVVEGWRAWVSDRSATK